MIRQIWNTFRSKKYFQDAENKKYDNTEISVYCFISINKFLSSHVNDIITFVLREKKELNLTDF